MADGLVVPSAKLCEAVARTLVIVDHETGETRPWVPNSEQIELWEALERDPFLYALKGRQIGATTAVLLWVALFVALNTAAGHVIRAALVWDTDTKVLQKIEQIADFLSQLGIAVEPKRHEVTWSNGSTIVGLTAGGRRVGAGLSFHLIHASELPYWQDAQKTMNALMPALNLAGRFVVETTMGLGQQIAVDLYREPNKFRKLFFKVEDHAEYRADPDTLPPDVEEWLRNEGFTRRDTMAWLATKLQELGGDRIELLREYPNRPEHCFASAQGRWIRVTSPVLEHEAIRVGTETLKVFRPLAQTSGQLVIGVDTAGGVGRDRSAVVVIDKRDEALCASYVDADCTVDTLVAVTRAAFDAYTAPPKAPFPGARPAPSPLPTVLVETNGIGRTTYQGCIAAGVPAIDITTTADSAYGCLLAAKRAVEAGTFKGPGELADECNGLHVEDGKFKGPKDLCMASGFAFAWIAKDPYRPPVEPRDRETYDLAGKLAKLGRKSGMGSFR